MKTFTDGVTLTTAGSQSVTVTDTVTSSITGNQTGLVITPAAANYLTLTGLTGAVAGTPQTATVTAYDQYNNVATGYLGTVQFTSSDTNTFTQLPDNYTFVAGDNGVKTFTDGVTLTTAGSQSVTVTDTVTSSITGNQTGLVITPAAANYLTLTGLTGAVAGTPQTATVTAYDQYNNVATQGYLGTVQFTSSDTNTFTQLPDNYTFVAGDNGVKTFTDGVTLTTAGSQSVTVTDTVTSSITGNQTGLVITPAAANYLTLTGLTGAVAGTPQTATVTAYDEYNNVATGYLGTVQFTSSDTNTFTQLPDNYTFVAGDNRVEAFTDGVTLTTAGSQSVTVTDTVTSSITGNQTGLVITPAAANYLTLTGLTGAVAGTPQTATVTAYDQYNNVATGYLGTVQFTSSDTNTFTQLPDNYTFVAGDNGVKTFTDGVTLTTAGSKCVTVTDTVTSSITGNQTGLVITPAAANYLTLTGLTGAVAGTPQTATVTAYK